jgi:hypothetical protein
MSVVAVGRDTRTEIGDSCEDTPERVHHHHQHPDLGIYTQIKFPGTRAESAVPSITANSAAVIEELKLSIDETLFQAAASSSITPALFEWSMDEREMVN